jgi:hypothetical protein
VGGIGSGRRTSEATMDDCIRIPLSDLKRLGMIKRHCTNRRTLSWTCDGRVTAELTLVCDVDCHEPFPCLKITRANRKQWFC